MSRRVLFPLLALAVALVLWLLQDRIFPPAPKPAAPPARRAEPAPDPSAFDMTLRPGPRAKAGTPPASTTPPPAPVTPPPTPVTVPK